MDSSGLKVYVTSYSEEVTGSNNHVKVEWPDGRSTAFVVDCGLFQEALYNKFNENKFPYIPTNIAFAIATHVHTDHVGRFPYLRNSGFDGKVYTSHETAEMLPIVLSETADRLKEKFDMDCRKYKSKKLAIKLSKLKAKGRGRRDKPRRSSKKKLEDNPKCPTIMYEKEDIPVFMQNVIAVDMFEAFTPIPGIEITFYPNAHIGGAVLTVCKIFNATETMTLLFTGDLGMTNPITNGVTEIPKDVCDKVDVIISESTYGCGTYTREIEKERKKHKAIIQETKNKNGTIMYMSNSLERPERLCVDLKEMQGEEGFEWMKKTKIYFDSTFGIKCYRKYEQLYGTDYMPENFEIIDKTSREKVQMTPGYKMIICTSPRLFQGSFLTYGPQMLENPNVTLVFVAYIPENVRNIVNLPRGTEIDFMGERITLRCKMQLLTYYSSHVSTMELDGFLSKFANAKTLLFNHGTQEAKCNYVDRYKTPKNHTHNLLCGKTVMLTNNGIEKYY